MTASELNDLLDYARHKNLSATALQVLNHLHATGESRINDICRACGVTPAAMTHCSDRLVADGHITRRSCKRDRRNVWLEITPGGSALIDTALRGPVLV